MVKQFVLTIAHIFNLTHQKALLLPHFWVMYTQTTQQRGTGPLLAAGTIYKQTWFTRAYTEI